MTYALGNEENKSFTTHLIRIENSCEAQERLDMDNDMASC